MSRIIHIVGAPCSGKSTLRRALADALGLPSFSIDDERVKLMGPLDRWPPDDGIAWARLRAATHELDVAIVETSGLSRNDAWLMAPYAGPDRFTVLCSADPYVRRARLIERVRSGHPLARSPNYVERLLRLGDPHGAGIDAGWASDRPASIAPLVALVRDWLAPVAVARAG